MTKDELKKKFCGILNISPTAKEKVFQSILEKISAKLDDNNAMEIDQLGIFVLREEPLTREERSIIKTDFGMTKKVVYFLPKRKPGIDDTDAFYLTFDLSSLDKTSNNYSDEIFSLSIDAPLLPVYKTDDVQSSFSPETENLDNKIDELINSSEILQDFDFWSEVTSYTADESEVADSVEDESELRDLVAQSKLDDDKEYVIVNVNKEMSSSEEDLEEFGDELIDQEEIQDFSDDVTPIIDEDELKTDTELDNLSDKAESNIDEGWNWGDELKKEFQDEETIDASDINEPEEDSSEIEEKKSIYEDPFEEVEKTISVIDEQIESDETELREEGSEPQFDSKKNEDKNIIVEKPLEREIKDYEPQIDKPSHLSFGPIFWIVLSVIIFLGFFLIYFFYSEDDNKKVDEVKRYSSTKPKMELGGEIKPSDTLTGGEYYQDGIDSLEQFGEIYIPQEQIGDAKVESESTTKSVSGSLQLGELYRQIPNENQLSNLVFYDGSKYNVQVASHKSSDGAEAMAKKLRNLGYDAFIVETYLPALKGTWYRVRVGFFDTKEEAEKFRKDNNSIIN